MRTSVPSPETRAAPPVIDVRPQHTIPLGKAFALCLKGIAHRLFRSLLTLTVIVLAVAFFMALLTESAFTQAVARGVRAENRESRTFSRRLGVWFSEPDETAMSERLVAARDAPEEAKEIAAVSGVSASEIENLALDAEREAAVVRFFESLDAGSRAILVKKTRPDEVLDYLADHQRFAELAREIARMHAVKPPYAVGEIERIVARHPRYITELAALTSAWRRGVQEFKEDLAKKTGTSDLASLRELLASGDHVKLEELGNVLGAHGFEDSAVAIATIHLQVAARVTRERIQERLLADDARAAWHEAYLEDPLIDAKMLRLDDDPVVRILGNRFTRAELGAVSRDIARESNLLMVEKAVAERLPAGRTPTTSLLSGRQAFLMTISFVVCMVGITNAMLMAITERFREIATMKCLGATDSFILQQSLMEAAVQGMAGGVAGMLIGAILTTIKCAVVYGSYLLGYFPWANVLAGGGISVLTGVFLSTLASIYPSWSASRMAPMDAMRVE
jgi:FtsX-like permease family